MYRCSPVEMRKNLDIVRVLENQMIDFVVIPVFSEEEKEKYIEILGNQLSKAEKLAEEEESGEQK